MKVLQVVPFFSLIHGGSSLVPYNFSKELSKRGHEVTVYTSDYKMSEEWIQSLPRVKVYPLKTISILANFYMTKGLIDLIRKEIKDFDIIHLHNYRTFQNIITHYYAKKYDVPYIVHAHGSLPRINSLKTLKWIYDIIFGYRLLKEASRVIALSSVEAEQYKQMGVSKEKIDILPNGISLSENNALSRGGAFKRKFDIPYNRKIVLYVGRIHKTKGIDLLVKAFKSLITEFGYTNSLLVIAGSDDGYLAEIKSLVNSMGISNSVLFAGFISNEDKRDALVDADVFVTPSFYGFPVTFLEAFATGTPIVTTNLGDTLEWIDNNAGFETQPTPIEIANAIYKILSNDGLHRKLSRNCINIFRSKYTLEIVVIQLEQIYQKMSQAELT